MLKQEHYNTNLNMYDGTNEQRYPCTNNQTAPNQSITGTLSSAIPCPQIADLWIFFENHDGTTSDNHG